MKKLHILVIGDPPIITHSVAVVCAQLAKHWVKLGHKVSYLGYNYTGKEIEHPDGYIIYPDIKPPTRQESVEHYIKTLKPDIVYSHGSKDVFKEGMQACKKFGIPYVPHTFYSTPTKNDKVNTFEAKNGFILYDCEHVDDMFVCNNFSTGVGFAIGKRTWFVPNGVDTDIFYPNLVGDVIIDDYKHNLEIPDDAFVFLFSGSNLSGKDPGRALDAFIKFYEKHQGENVYLAMHTRPTNSHLDLRNIAANSIAKDNVKFFTDAFPEWLEQPEADESYQKGSFSPPYTTTPYDKMGKVFRTGHVQLVPTLMEGMSTTILEGMGCGLPVICSDDEVVSEPVTNFATGLLCRRLLTNECVTEDVIKHMETFYNDRELTTRMGVAASEYTKIKHSWETISKQFIYHFNNLIDGWYK